MLAFFRTLSQSKIVWIIIGIPLVGGLLLVGNTRANLSGLFTPQAIITAGSRVYSPREFKREFDGDRQRLAQQGQTLTVDEMVAKGL